MPQTADATSRLFELILSMDPKDAPAPAVLERLLDAALAEERRLVVAQIKTEMDAEFRDEDGEYPAVGPYALMYAILDEVAGESR